MTDNEEVATPEVEPTEKPKTTRAPRQVEKTSPLADLTDLDLVDQSTGRPAPISASTDNLQATISTSAGRSILKVAMKGYIGEEPVAILAQDAGEFTVLIKALEDAAVAQKKAFAKSKG
jgi:hypothetical protein